MNSLPTHNAMKTLQESTRRKFFKQASLLGAAAITSPGIFNVVPQSEQSKDGEQFTFLFQGDSITDGNRTRDLDWNHVLGHGYVYIIAAALLYNLPEKKFHFFNRGISGNKVTDLALRWQEDTIAIKPDLVSILIGVNDTMNAVYGNPDCTVAGYENDFRALLVQTKEKLPGVELVICEPFILPVGKVKERWQDFQREISGRQEAAKRLATEFNAIYIPLQDSFNRAFEKYPPENYWLWDGIHPMPNGHELIAREWVRLVGKKLKFINS